MKGLAAANRERIEEARRGRREIEEADAIVRVPAWAKPDLLAVIQRDPKRLVAALAALEAMRTDPATPRHDRHFVAALVTDLEALTSTHDKTVRS